MANSLLQSYNFVVWSFRVFCALVIFIIVSSFVIVFSAGEVSTYKLEAQVFSESLFYYTSYYDPLIQKNIPGMISSDFSLPQVSDPNNILVKATLVYGNNSVVQYFPNEDLFNTYYVVKDFEEQIYELEVSKIVYVKDAREGGTLVLDVLHRK